MRQPPPLWPREPWGPRRRCVPLLLNAAAQAGNVSAMGLMAQIFEVQTDGRELAPPGSDSTDFCPPHFEAITRVHLTNSPCDVSQVQGRNTDQCEALRWWLKAAKAGDLEAMFKIGFATYEGDKGNTRIILMLVAWLTGAGELSNDPTLHTGIEADSEASMSWLGKAVKKVFSVASLSLIRVDTLVPKVHTGGYLLPSILTAPPSGKWEFEAPEIAGLPTEQEKVVAILAARAALVSA